MPDLRLEDVTVRYDGETGPLVLFDKVSAVFSAGAATRIEGPTGSGKTTLLHLLAALRRPTSGTVWTGEEPISRYTADHRDRFRRRVGLVFQHTPFWSGLTVLENVMLPLLPVGGSLETMQQRSLVALERVQLGALAGRDPAGLSGGQRQRLGLARALVSEPEFLLLDEPTAHQDTLGVQRISSLVEEEARRGAVVVVATHDERLRQALPASLCLRVSEGCLEPVS